MQIDPLSMIISGLIGSGIVEMVEINRMIKFYR
jgi:hypothetical protein